MSKRLAPLAYMIKSKQNRRWSPPEALAELIDNSLAPAKGEADNILIALERHNIRVVDDGNGIDDINRVFQLGNHAEASEEELGLFGVGATDATIWLGNELAVTTTYEGRIHHHGTSWARCLEENEWPVAYEGAGRVAAKGARGTVIDIRDLRHRTHLESIVNYLSYTYAPALKAGRTIKILDQRKPAIIESVLYPAKPPDVALMDIASEVVVGEEVLPWKGQAGYSSSPLTKDQNRVHIGYGYRIIEATQEPFNGAAMGVYATVELGSAWKYFLSDHKDAVVRYRAELMQSIAEELQPFIKMAKSRSIEIQTSKVKAQLETILAPVLSSLGTTGVPGTLTGRSGAGGGPHPGSGPQPRQPREAVPDPDGKAVAPGDGTAGNPAKAPGIVVEFTNGNYFGAGLEDIFGSADIGSKVVVYLNLDNDCVADWKDDPVRVEAFQMAIADVLASEVIVAWNRDAKRGIKRFPTVSHRLAKLENSNLSTVHNVLVAEIISGMKS